MGARLAACHLTRVPRLCRHLVKVAGSRCWYTAPHEDRATLIPTHFRDGLFGVVRRIADRNFSHRRLDRSDSPRGTAFHADRGRRDLVDGRRARGAE